MGHSSRGVSRQKVVEGQKSKPFVVVTFLGRERAHAKLL